MLKFNEITIAIRNLRVSTLIGVPEFERKKKQELTANIAMKIDRKGIPLSDKLCDTVDYAAVAEHLTDWMALQESHLLEHLAHRTMLKLFDFDARIVEIELEIFKPSCIPFADGASIKMSYSRNESSYL
jgi:dihydroneopterin aldolase